jgi:hypothetical protein
LKVLDAPEKTFEAVRDGLGNRGNGLFRHRAESRHGNLEIFDEVVVFDFPRVPVVDAQQVGGVNGNEKPHVGTGQDLTTNPG